MIVNGCARYKINKTSCSYFFILSMNDSAIISIIFIILFLWQFAMNISLCLLCEKSSLAFFLIPICTSPRTCTDKPFIMNPICRYHNKYHSRTCYMVRESEGEEKRWRKEVREWHLEVSLRLIFFIRSSLKWFSIDTSQVKNCILLHRTSWIH